MPIYVCDLDTESFHPGLGMNLVPGENDIPEDKVDLADGLPYLHRQGELGHPDMAEDEADEHEDGGQEPEA